MSPLTGLRAGAVLLLALGQVPDLRAQTPSEANAAAAAQADDEADRGALPTQVKRSPRDPFERFNRSMYQFNDKLDVIAVKPVAEGYRRLVPELARAGVDNFFGNLGDAWSAVNKLLQGKVVQSAQMTLRFATNSVFGLAGVLDPATEFGLEKQSEDFGQTLGTWGLPTGPYLVLPVFGPSTVRDAAALVLDKSVGSATNVLGTSGATTVEVTALQLVNVRAGLLGASKLFDDIALDKYSFLRDAYLARRRNQIYDGNPPEEPEAADPR